MLSRALSRNSTTISKIYDTALQTNTLDVNSTEIRTENLKILDSTIDPDQVYFEDFKETCHEPKVANNRKNRAFWSRQKCQNPTQALRGTPRQEDSLTGQSCYSTTTSMRIMREIAS